MLPHPPRLELESKLAAAWPPGDWSEVTVLLAVSGGSDSVALLRAMAAIKGDGPGRLCAAHVNHHLRAEADADEAFVVDLCRRLGIPCEVGHAAVTQAAADAGDGIEAAARQARYRFLEDAAGRLGARFVVTAHTADDQAETILHRIIRGTGVGGLAGMARTRPLGHAALIHPLLGIRRAELAAYLDALAQPCRQDLSNADLRFTRNRIRHELLPWLAEQFNSGVIEALLRLGTLAGETQAVVDRLATDLLERCVRADGPGDLRIDTAELTGQPRYLVRELLIAAWQKQNWPMQSMGFAQWEQLADMSAAGAAAKQMFPGGVLAEVAAGQLRLSK
jgi:tRNA(Ile)-lysidine synthase